MKKIIIAAAAATLFSTMATANSGLADRFNEARSYPHKTTESTMDTGAMTNHHEQMKMNMSKSDMENQHKKMHMKMSAAKLKSHHDS